MSEGVVARLRAARIEEHELPGGLKCKLRRPHRREAIMAGDIPAPIIAEIEKLKAKGKSDEAIATEMEAKHGKDFIARGIAVTDELIRRSIVELDGEPVSYADLEGVALGEMFSEAQWEYLSDYVNRQDAEGKG